MRVLLVEDNDLIRDYLQICLADEGHEVLAFPDAAAALETVEAGRRPDLIVTDFNLGDASRGDGVDFAAAVKVAAPESELLVISGNPQQAQEKVRHAGFGTFLAKPFTRAMLLAAVARATTH